jgi:hypothetical protein
MVLPVQEKQLWMGPNVVGVGRNEEGQIADQPYSFAVRVRLQSVCLQEHQELRKARQADLI